MSTRRLDLVTLGTATRHAIDTAARAGCTDAEMRVLLGVIALTVTWGKLTDRASTGQVAVAAGLWNGEAVDCPKWLRNKIGQRLQTLADAGVIKYKPGGLGGWQGSTIALPKAPQGNPPEDALGQPLGGYPRATPERVPGATRERVPGATRHGYPGQPLGGCLPVNDPGKATSVRRNDGAQTHPVDELAAAYRRALAPSTRLHHEKAGTLDKIITANITTALEHTTPEHLAEILDELPHAAHLDHPGQLWAAIIALTDPDEHPTDWAHPLADKHDGDTLTPNPPPDPTPTP